MPAKKSVVIIFVGLLLVSLAVLIYTRYQHDIQRERARVLVGSRIVETPCGVIEYGMAGKGPPLMVVHGAGGGFDQGLEFSEALVQRGFSVIAMSRFGYLHTPVPADASIIAQADAHACLLDALNIPRVAIVGASAGAPSAMQFALRYPARTSALVLLVPVAYAPRPEGVPAVQSPAGLEFLFDTALKSDFLFWAGLRLVPQTMIRALLATPPAIVKNASAEEQARISHMLQHILPISPRRLGLLNDAAVIASLKRYELERIAVPTLIFSAEDDLFGTYQGARYSAEHIPRARFVGYATGGHMWVGHQQEVIAEIASFLKNP